MKSFQFREDLGATFNRGLPVRRKKPKKDDFHYVEAFPPTEKKTRPTKPCRISQETKNAAKHLVQSVGKKSPSALRTVLTITSFLENKYTYENVGEIDLEREKKNNFSEYCFYCDENILAIFHRFFSFQFM